MVISPHYRKLIKIIQKDLIMNDKKLTTEEVIDIAIRFLEEKAGYYFHKLISVKYDEKSKKWYLEFKVSILLEEYVKIAIDETGKVVEYEFFEKKPLLQTV